MGYSPTETHTYTHRKPNESFIFAANSFVRFLFNDLTFLVWFGSVLLRLPAFRIRNALNLSRVIVSRSFLWNQEVRFQEALVDSVRFDIFEMLFENNRFKCVCVCGCVSQSCDCLRSTKIRFNVSKHITQFLMSLMSSFLVNPALFKFSLRSKRSTADDVITSKMFGNRCYKAFVCINLFLLNRLKERKKRQVPLPLANKEKRASERERRREEFFCFIFVRLTDKLNNCGKNGNDGRLTPTHHI